MASLDENIKKYIENINTSLTSHSSSVHEFIKSINNIESQIKKFDENYGQIHKSRDYIILRNLIKLWEPNSDNQGVTPEQIKIIDKISKSMLDYINDSHIFNINKRILSPIMVQLKHYSSEFVGKTVTYEENKSGSSIIDPVLNPLDKLKFYLDKFDKNMMWVKKLQEIGEYIQTMKNTLKDVESKVDEGAARYIKGLQDITINSSKVENDIKTIKGMNESVIARLQIARHTIEFYNSLQGEISKLNDVEFKTYDISEFYKNSSEIKEKLRSFKSQIKLHLNTLKQSYESIQGHTVVMQGDTYEESFYENLVKPVESFIDVISNIIELKCGIEGIVRNLVHCSLPSLTPDTRVVENKKRIKNNNN